MAGLFNVTVNNDISSKFNALASQANNMLQNLIVAESETLTPYLQQNAPIGKYYDLSGDVHYGGQLLDSLRFVVGQWGSYLSGAKQGVFVAAGTKPHEIAARRAPRLAFFSPTWGHAAFPVKVNHPGTKANDFRWNGWQQAMDEDAVKDTAVRVLMDWGRSG